MGFVTLGLDIGQRRDPTALVVAEREWREREGGTLGEVHHIVRFLERLPLGTPYPQVVTRVVSVVRNLVDLGNDPLTLYLDATGVGSPVADLLRDAPVLARLVPVYFTHGDRRSETNGELRVGKAWLVSRLQALLQSGRLHLPQTAEAAALVEELLAYEIRVDARANDTYGAFKVGKHDDLVTALGLATLDDVRLEDLPMPILYTSARRRGFDFERENGR